MTGVLLLMSCTSLNDLFLRELPPETPEEEDTQEGPPRLSCDQSALTFGSLSVTSGDERTLEVVCDNPGTDSLTINNVVNATNVFSASVSTTTVAAGGELTITVTFTPTHSGEFSDELLLFTDAAATPQLTFPLSGFGLAPEIALSPESLSFGSLPVGCDSQRTVTISNTGTESLTISDLDLPEPFGFDAEISLPWTISAGGSREVGLTFAPEQVQGSSEVLTVTSSDPLPGGDRLGDHPRRSGGPLHPVSGHGPRHPLRRLDHHLNDR